MPSKEPRKLFSIHKPFALLVGLRDGELNHVEQLTTDQSEHKTVICAEHLDADGVVAFNRETGELVPNRTFFDALNSINFRLSELTEFTGSSIVANPVFRSRLMPAKERKHADLFVLMPFSDALLPFYQDHIRPTIERMGHSCGRADDFFTADAIIEGIWTAIRNARVILADCTGRNPNVFYEIGIAHTVGKPVVLLSQSVDDIPFDLRHRRTIVYEYSPRGVKQFEEVLAKTVQWEITAEQEEQRPTMFWKRFVRRGSE